jgi:serine/threonine-protein kinase
VSEQLSAAGPYQIVDVLQRGARAVIYIALRPESGQEVVLKMAKDPWRGSADVAASPASQLVHRHIVRVLDQGEHNGFPYTVMERLQGRTLQEMMADPAFAADLPTRIDLIAQLCIGLHHAHEHQIVHGNVTPDNIFVTDDGVTKVLNIGATTGVDHTVVSDNALAGSFEYMSPEQIIGRDTLDGRSDMFSAAVILYELVSGRRPFQAGTTTATLARVLRDDPPPLEGLDRLNAILRRALEKEPAKRFASAQEFAYALWMMDIPDATLEQEADVDLSASVTMFADAKYDDAEEEAANAPAPAVAGVVMTKQMAIYAAIAAGIVIVAAAAFVSC